jgi:hypothetical protein
MSHSNQEIKMYPSRVFALTAVAVLGLLPVAATAAPAQKYGPWKGDKDNYSYRTYSFAPPGGKESVHVVINYRDDPKHYYYWNPRTKQFWGRGEIVESGCGCSVQQYQMLAEPDRKADLAQIKPTAFGKPAATPKLTDITPGLAPAAAADDARLALPQDKPPPAFLKARG